MVELGQLQRHFGAIQEKGVEIYALSVDPPEVNAALRQRLGFSYRFLSDEKGELADKLGVMTPDYNLAKDGGGVIFPTQFLVDENGTIQWVFEPETWRKRARPEEVMQAIENMPSE